MLDSIAAFRSRMVEVGLGDKWEVFKAAGWTSFGAYAFSTSFTPGTIDDAPFIKGVVMKVVGAEDDPLVPALRRLLYESYTLYVADVKTRMERTEDTAPRKLVVPERASRRERLASRIQGVDLSGELDVAYSLVDRCVQMAEDDILTYIPWEICAKRSQELRGHKIMKEFKPDSRGFMRECEVPATHMADLTSDLRVMNTLRRRGVAMDMANLLTFEMHEKLVRHLMEAYQEDPPRGYRAVDLDQLRRADETVFQMLVDATRHGIKPRADGTLPLDDAMQQALSSHKLVMTLSPLQMGSSSGSKGNGKKREHSDDEAPARGSKRQRAKNNLKKQLEEVKSE
jgi:hypothetical protein